MELQKYCYKKNSDCVFAQYFNNNKNNDSDHDSDNECLYDRANNINNAETDKKR